MSRAGSAAGSAAGAAVVCLACRVDFDECRHSGEATYFATTHNDLHHGSLPIAFTVTVEIAAAPTPTGPLGPAGPVGPVGPTGWAGMGPRGGDAA